MLATNCLNGTRLACLQVRVLKSLRAPEFTTTSDYRADFREILPANMEVSLDGSAFVRLADVLDLKTGQVKTGENSHNSVRFSICHVQRLNSRIWRNSSQNLPTKNMYPVLSETLSRNRKHQTPNFPS